ncbi:uncharacterized protein SPAPADRAFT_63007 [Spathaspora passalidarum NRRL Y-27907]|uniref:MARVEL domain-containing protein n=1 Tax=Spathaspora passalidarum (strain NRRL Y-27907 / 11-Y1) TaxID=619300 RepID=G3ASG2_SPAPN|nr:uncharacterized protein SPAPADRAFT_63007 [Spathaspora passalidarum NRRL Y-27907]EGW31080.1 hypothetical protein SPAPADRAFT_63007 [Spathaspora passalidarum NRRL Y-27907]
MILKEIFTYSIRGAEGLFALLVLGLSAGYLGVYGHNVDRISYTLVVSILNLIYFGYIGGVLPFVTEERAPSLSILLSEGILSIFYLASMGSIADMVSGVSCDLGDYYFDGNQYYSNHKYKTTCHIAKALIPFTLFNWLLFTASLLLFVFYSFIPEVSTYGWGHIIQLTKYHFGAIWANYAQPPFKKVIGAEEKGVATGGEVAPAAAVVDEEAQIGSSDEEARENKYAEATSTEGDDHPVKQHT